MKWEMVRLSGKYQWILKSKNGRRLLSSVLLDTPDTLKEMLQNPSGMKIDGSRVERKKGSIYQQLVLRNQEGVIIAFGQTYRSLRGFNLARIKVELAMKAITIPVQTL